MPKWCWNWPHCWCGVEQARTLEEGGQRLLVYRNDVGDIKRVPTSELKTYAIVEGLQEEQLTAGCPRTRGNDGDQ